MLENLLSLIEQHDVVLITGRPGTGKSWLLSQIPVNIHQINKVDAAMKGDDATMTPLDFSELISTKKKIISVDEAQLLGDGQLTEITKHVLDNGLKLVVLCQSEHQISGFDLTQSTSKKDYSFIHIEMNGLDNQPTVVLSRGLKLSMIKRIYKARFAFCLIAFGLIGAYLLNRNIEFLNGVNDFYKVSLFVFIMLVGITLIWKDRSQ
jgi:hypothetical protein